MLFQSRTSLYEDFPADRLVLDLRFTKQLRGRFAGTPTYQQMLQDLLIKQILKSSFWGLEFASKADSQMLSKKLLTVGRLWRPTVSSLWVFCLLRVIEHADMSLIRCPAVTEILQFVTYRGDK